MKPTFRKSMIWLHTWTGLVGGWLIFAVFFTGTLIYYKTELTHWIQGNTTNTTHTQQELIAHSFEWLEEQGKDHKFWQVQLPDDRGLPYRISYGQRGDRTTVYLNPNDFSEEPLTETYGANFFRVFHYTLYIWEYGGRYFVGIAAMMMLIGVFSGIYTHKRFIKDFFTIRRGKWSKQLIDVHAVFGVITIPFCIVLSLSALLIYINTYLPFSIDHYYESYRKLDAEVTTRYTKVTPSDEIAELASADKFHQQLVSYWGAEPVIKRISVSEAGTENARLIFYRHSQFNLTNKSESIALKHNAEIGEVMEEERLARKIRRVFYGIHEAHFADPVFRFMLFGLGLASCWLIASGMIIWLQKRLDKKPGRRHFWLAKANHAFIYGLTLASACFLSTSRLPGLAQDAVEHVELPMFFYAWLASVILCLLLKEKLSKLVIIAANAVGFLLLVGLDLLPGNGMLITAIGKADWIYLGISILYLATAGYFGWATRSAYREWKQC